MTILQIIWFAVISALLVGYVILDGYDLGVGIWHLFSKNPTHRRKLLRSILPYWDGNEVWLVTAGAMVFAAFPAVYASVFSGFYLAMMLVLVALIFRAVSIEFATQEVSQKWESGWNLGFGFGSLLPALLFGVAAGNLLRGLPLNNNGDYTGSFFALLNPYSLLVGVTGLVMFAMHGALWARMKSDGDLAVSAARWANQSWYAFFALLLVSIVVTVSTQSQLIANYLALPLLWMLPVLMLAAFWMAGLSNRRGRSKFAFISSSMGIFFLFATLGAALFPNMVSAVNDPGLSLTIANSSSSELTLKVMLIITLSGMPIVIGYQALVHKWLGEGEEDEGY